jgi:ATP-dependent DNA helicase RecG
MPVTTEPTTGPPASDPAPATSAERIRPLARAFATARPLGRSELLDAPVRWPRPSRLQAPLELPAKRMASGMRALGLITVGELLEHLPSDSREARTLAALRTGEQATVAVQVRRITARAVRRRGMRPLVQATVFDPTATITATFFNQPWLLERYPPGTRLLLHGTADGRGGFRVSHHAVGGHGPGGGGAAAPPSGGAAPATAHQSPPGAPSPTTRPPTASPRRRS